MKAVILCGGLATRMLPISKCVPKEMMPILNKPLLEYLIDDLVSNGIKDVLVVTNRGKESIENYFDCNVEIEQRLSQTGKTEMLETLKRISEKCNIMFLRQIHPLGTGHALMRAKSFVGNDNFIFLFGDELLYNPQKGLTSQLLEKFNETHNSVISVKKCNIADCEKYGMIKFKNNTFEQIIEKPKPENAPSDVCYLGNSIFTPQIFDYIKIKEKGETHIVDAINAFAKHNKVEIKHIEGERFDAGNKLGFVKANVFYGLQDESIRGELITFLKEMVEKC